MSDLWHSDFVDRVCEAAEQHPDEYDPYWEEFWSVKSSSDTAPIPPGAKR